MSDENCLFCKIVKKEIPAEVVLETKYSLAFMDINPLSEGHLLVIPKEHTEKMHENSDESLSDILISLKKLVNATPVKNYNILQNNGRIAHQLVMHTHFHLIPKPEQDKGLGIVWTTRDGIDQKAFAEKLREKL